jgi:hypothetical protein
VYFSNDAAIGGNGGVPDYPNGYGNGGGGGMGGDGAPAESYRDDGNRWLFANANSGWDQPPKAACAPVLTGGPIVDRHWRRLLDRAGERPGLPLSDEPDLHLLCDDQRIDGRPADGTVTFALARRPTKLRIVSRAASPAELGLARDPRHLGVAIRQIQLWQGRHIAFASADDDRLSDGFHAYEPDANLRWTNGDAALPPELLDGFAGPFQLKIQLGATTQYVVD